MLIVVSRSSVTPASRRPEIDDPMMASLLDATVAGPYMYFTVTSPVISKCFMSLLMMFNMYWGVFTFAFCNHNSCSSFRTDTWWIITLDLNPIPHCASHYHTKKGIKYVGMPSCDMFCRHESQLPSSSMLRSVGMPSCDMFATSQISDCKRRRSFVLTSAECPTSQIICFADSRATYNTITNGLGSRHWR